MVQGRSPWSRAMLSYEPEMFWICYPWSLLKGLSESFWNIWPISVKRWNSVSDPRLYEDKIQINKLWTSKYPSFIKQTDFIKQVKVVRVKRLSLGGICSPSVYSKAQKYNYFLVQGTGHFNFVGTQFFRNKWTRDCGHISASLSADPWVRRTDSL